MKLLIPESIRILKNPKTLIQEIGTKPLDFGTIKVQTVRLPHPPTDSTTGHQPEEFSGRRRWVLRG